VLDVPGGYGKAPVGPVYLRDGEAGGCVVTDPDGGDHAYPPPQD
jgi:lysine 2,3-aminomutase